MRATVKAMCTIKLCKPEAITINESSWNHIFTEFAQDFHNFFLLQADTGAVPLNVFIHECKL